MSCATTIFQRRTNGRAARRVSAKALRETPPVRAAMARLLTCCATTIFQWRTSGAGEVRHHHRRPYKKVVVAHHTPPPSFQGGKGEPTPLCPPLQGQLRKGEIR